jgi:hypothetical protein
LIVYIHYINNETKEENEMCKTEFIPGWIAGAIAVNWSIRRIASSFNVSSTVAKMYFQPCFKPAQVQTIVNLIGAIDRSTD